MRSKRVLLAIWLALAGVRLVLGISFIRSNSATGDEPLYITAGYITLHSGDYSVNSGHPPLAKLLAGAAASLVWDPPYEHDRNWRGGVYRPFDEFFYADRVYATLGQREELVTIVARVPGMLLGLALCLLCGLWAHRLCGPEAGVLALGLAALDPNLIAHSGVAGTDGPLAFFLVLAIYLAWAYARRPSRRLLVGIGLAFGLAMATKFSAIALVPAIALLLFYAARAAAHGEQGHRWIARAIGAGLAVAGIALLVLVASYAGYGLYQLWIGMGSQLAHQSSGHPSFLLGELSSDGWWYYVPVVLFAKTPAVTLVVVGSALVLWRWRSKPGWLDTMSLLLPVALLVAFHGLVSPDVGVRYLLAAYPFLFVAAGRLMSRVPARARAAALVASLGAVAATTVPSAPHQIAYFSHFIGGADRGHEWLSDSNIDWGQDLGGLADWLHERGDAPVYLAYYGRFPPRSYGIRFRILPSFSRPPVEPVDSTVDGAPRYLAVSVTNLHGTYIGRSDWYAWLQPYEPIAKIGYSIFIYDLDRIPGADRRMAELSTAAGQPAMAPRGNER